MQTVDANYAADFELVTNFIERLDDILESNCNEINSEYSLKWEKVVEKHVYHGIFTNCR